MKRTHDLAAMICSACGLTIAAHRVNGYQLSCELAAERLLLRGEQPSHTPERGSAAVVRQQLVYRTRQVLRETNG